MLVIDPIRAYENQVHHDSIYVDNIETVVGNFAMDFKYIPGTLQIHQVTTLPGNSEEILFKDSSCACASCLNGMYSMCERRGTIYRLP